MNKYLLQILHDVNTIIIPGLGALTVTNKSTGEIMFMSYLKHDDGNLARYISEKENISENDAKNQIAKYVREIQAKLDTGETYDMYQFGRFIKKNGDIDFESWNSYQHPANEEDLVPDTEVEEDLAPKTHHKPVEEPEVKAAKPAPKKAPEVENKPEAKEEKSEISGDSDATSDVLEVSQAVVASSSLDDILNKEEKNVPQTQEPVEGQKAENEPLDAVPAPKDPRPEVVVAEVAEDKPELDVSSIKPSENVYIPKEEAKEMAAKQAKETAKGSNEVKKQSPQKEISDKMNEPIVAVAPETGEKRKKGKKSVLFWVMVIVIFFLVAGGGTTAFFYKEIFGENTVKQTEKVTTEKSDENLEEIEKQVALETQEEARETENTVQEQEVKEEPAEVKQEVVEKPAKAAVSADRSYHIIAGGFGVEANAERLAKKYQAEGKNASVLGKFDDLYLVSYEAFATQQEAGQALKSSGIKGWIFKYPK